MRREIVERINMEVPMEHAEKLTKYCFTYQYRIISSGPKVDTSTFMVVAERVLMKTYKDDWVKELLEE